MEGGSTSEFLIFFAARSTMSPDTFFIPSSLFCPTIVLRLCAEREIASEALVAKYKTFSFVTDYSRRSRR